MTGFGICGLGNIGAVHLANLRTLRGCRVAGVFDVRPEVAGAAARDHGVRAYTHLADLFRDPAVTAVVVATPADTHKDITLAALAAGKHVFVEKPLSNTLADAESIVRAAAGSDRVVQVGFCERFNPQYLEAKRAVAAGAVGRVRAVFSGRVAPVGLADMRWPLGALDTAVHNLDLILWLAGAEPVAVSAAGVSVHPGSDGPHAVTTRLRFADGAVATDDCAWLRDGAHPLRQCARSRMMVIGDAGVFDVDLTTRPNWLATDTDYRMADTVILGGPDYSGCLKHQFEAFLRAVEDGRPSPVPAADGLRAERVVVAALRSLRAGGVEVSIGDAQ